MGGGLCYIGRQDAGAQPNIDLREPRPHAVFVAGVPREDRGSAPFATDQGRAAVGAGRGRRAEDGSLGGGGGRDGEA